MNEELMKKFQAVSGIEELLSLAKAENIEISAEEAEALLGNKKETSGELADDELDKVSGGASTTIGSHEYMVVSSCYRCGNYEHGYNTVRGDLVFFGGDDNYGLRKTWYHFSSDGQCGRCEHLQFKGSTGVCDIPMD